MTTRSLTCNRAALSLSLTAALQPNERLKEDRASDALFYSYPRLVTHVDDGFINQLTDLYRKQIPAGGAVLDLMSSWVSHLPPEVSADPI